AGPAGRCARGPFAHGTRGRRLGPFPPGSLAWRTAARFRYHPRGLRRPGDLPADADSCSRPDSHQSCRMNPIPHVAHDMSILSLVLNASLLVQAVMALLLMLSLFSWT